MLQHEQVEELIDIISSWHPPTLIERILSFPASFPVDFTNEFLQSLPPEKLRHLFLALCLQQQHIPELQNVEAA